MPTASQLLIVEDGSGVLDANAFIDQAWADTYHALQRTAGRWNQASADEKAVGIVAATAYIEKRYFGQWMGVRSYALQGQQLSWPRMNVIILDSPEANSRRRYDVITKQYGSWIPFNVIPRQLKDATAILACKALDTDLMPDETREDYLLSSSVSVGSISESKAYKPGNPNRTIYRDAHALIRMLLDNAGSVMKISRT